MIVLHRFIQKAWSLFFRLILFWGRFNWLRDDLNGLEGCFFNQDIAPDLLAKSLVITMDKSKEGNIVSWLSRGSHSESNIDFSGRQNWTFNSERNSTEIIAISLNKESIFWPLSITWISESPWFGELLASKYWESIAEALLHKPSLIEDFLVSWLFLAFSWHALVLIAWWNAALHWLVVLLILAVDKSWCMFSLSDFQEWMTVSFLSFAFITKVEVWADTALITDSLNRTSLASVTSYTVMNLRSLIGRLLP